MMAGVKGMKWGVRKEPEIVLKKTLKNGVELTVTKNPSPAIGKLLSAISPAYKNYMSSQAHFTLKDNMGKTVGDASFHQDSPTSLNLMWVGVKTKHRGKGYASAVLDGVVKYASDKGLEKLTLEVPGNAPDALHIYEKLGFKKSDKQDVDGVDPYWGGLTNMELDLKSRNLQHAYVFTVEELIDYISKSIETEVDMTHSELAHAGVKGMKWGVHRSESAKRANRGASDHEDFTTSRKLKKTPIRELSNRDLKSLNARLNLEKNNKSLQSRGTLDKIKTGTAVVSTILAVGATANTAIQFANSPAGQAIKKTLTRS